MKLALTMASLVLVAGGAVGCGDDDDSASDKAASKDEFCGAFQSFYEDLVSLSGEEDNLGEILKKAAKRIRETGTPEDIPDDAKEGLEITLDEIDDLPDDASVEDLSGLDTELSEDEKKKTDAFQDYLEKTCPDIGESDGASEEDSGGGSSDDSGN